MYGEIKGNRTGYIYILFVVEFGLKFFVGIFFRLWYYFKVRWNFSEFFYRFFKMGLVSLCDLIKEV